MAGTKYKAGDVIFNGKGKILGTIIETVDTLGEIDAYNRYTLVDENGDQINLTEHQIVESKWHEEKNNG